MIDAGDMMLLGGGLIAVALAMISLLRLVQRLASRRYFSAVAFAIRLALSSYFIYVFFRLALF